MTTTATRETMISTGDHIGATRLLGATYTDAEYVEAILAAREVGVGEAYANAVLGSDPDALLRGVEAEGDAVVAAAESRLRRRGLDPRTATYRQYADALIEVSA